MTQNELTKLFATSIVQEFRQSHIYTGEYCTFCHSSRPEGGVIVHHDNCVVITAHNWLTDNTDTTPYLTITVDPEVGQDTLKIIRDYTDQYDD